MRMTALRRLVAGASVLLLAGQVNAAPGPHPLTPEELLRVQSVGNPQVSPDGSRVAYVVS